MLKLRVRDRSTRPSHPAKRWLTLLLVSGCSLSHAADQIGLPYTTVAYGLPLTQLGIEYIETAADPVIEPLMVEIVPDSYSRSYRNATDVYKDMTENSFDNEPMVVIAPETDHSLETDIVVIAAYTAPEVIHVTPSQKIVDPIARGEDAIYLQISLPPEPPGGFEPKAVIKPKERRFFSRPVE